MFICNLRRIRKELGLTQKELAGLTGIAQQTLSRWECEIDYPTVRSALIIAKALKRPIEAIWTILE